MEFLFCSPEKDSFLSIFGLLKEKKLIRELKVYKTGFLVFLIFLFASAAFMSF